MNPKQSIVFIKLLILLFMLISLFNVNDAANENYSLKEVEIVFKDGKPPKIFTAEEMKKYDGSDEHGSIYIGIKGVVFDVSSGKNFYNKKSEYNILVGKDSSRAVAKMSLEPEDMTPDISGLSPDTLKSLDEVFEQVYEKKYPIVGYMDYLKDRFPDKFSEIKAEL